LNLIINSSSEFKTPVNRSALKTTQFLLKKTAGRLNAGFFTENFGGQDQSQRNCKECNTLKSCCMVKFLSFNVKIISKTKENGRLKISEDGQFDLFFQYSINLILNDCSSFWKKPVLKNLC
jgi:hypothetical protein